MSSSHVSLDTSVILKVMPTALLKPSLDHTEIAMVPQTMCSWAAWGL